MLHSQVNVNLTVIKIIENFQDLAKRIFAGPK